MRAAFLAALLLAGCLAPAPSDPPPAAEPHLGVATALAECGDCWEPAAAVDGAGTIYVVLAIAPRMAVSTDGGRTFEERPTPPIPEGERGGRDVVDGYVAVAPDGTLHYAAFLGVLLPFSATPTGLHLARSPDGGRTWDANHVLSLANDRGHNVASPWKSWIGFGPGEDVYVSYNQRGGLVMVGKSEDGGRTWLPFQRINEGDVAVSNFPGTPMVDAGGRVAIPYFGDQTPSTTANPFFFQGHALKLAVSDDAGRTYRTVVAREAASPDFVGTGFPTMAIDAAGRWHIAYWDAQMRMVLITSSDRGETWSEPVAWSRGGSPIAGPWLTASHGELALLWQDNAPRLLLARAAEAAKPAPGQPAVAVEGTFQGDFAHFARMPDGRFVIPYPMDGNLAVALLPR